MTHLTQDIYGAILPKHSIDYEIVRCQDDYDKKYLKYDSDKYCGYQNYNTIDLGKENFEILGTASPEEITFDFEEFVKESIEGSEYKYGGELHPKEYYWDYDSRIYYLESARESFLSLIESKGIILKPNEKLLILKKL